MRYLFDFEICKHNYNIKSMGAPKGFNLTIPARNIKIGEKAYPALYTYQI